MEAAWAQEVMSEADGPGSNKLRCPGRSRQAPNLLPHWSQKFLQLPTGLSSERPLGPASRSFLIQYFPCTPSIQTWNWAFLLVKQKEGGRGTTLGPLHGHSPFPPPSLPGITHPAHTRPADHTPNTTLPPSAQQAAVPGLTPNSTGQPKGLPGNRFPSTRGSLSQRPCSRAQLCHPRASSFLPFAFILERGIYPTPTPFPRCYQPLPAGRRAGLSSGQVCRTHRAKQQATSSV